ncbi:head-tail joining protein [Massilia yuzhufengensis]|uniref:Uncharacterized protein n=1 Tax=Massilia yuzhufengensis TaxID=1164594 RepID=A0A1I1VSC9_9BURK|nr:hypothetical protein [Massilia yuzhufengensis]SFD83430.1 hypothetical protein SAMN05216204_14018 [Massilia yuzhufengensis]
MIFAHLEATANAAVLNHLANVQVAIAGATVPGIFRKPSSVAQLGHGAADTSPTVAVASSAVMADPVDQLIEIAGVPYAIVATAPDGTGLTLLTVECVQ